MTSGMECKKCKTPMHERASKNPQIKIRVFVCPKCQAIVYVDTDGDVKEDTK